ncbi:Formyl-coenzyme A transferase [Solibacillus isronensis B3W22]|uniref:Formyl-coenzyme A transferase n=1 Tax=Solibacillus isronensis B3W22 TaxID=1224748 RepID=K1KM04_9BACL|nr:CoA transferase [Solibacillus isronensis]AMO87442.1 formyl-CoA transferase [Solibacillus silvestris]EKB43531.1 Formyl-coenzyme A transferase [Solibacillus isronensis B3W22]
MKPLQGIRVLDMTTNISGPTLTMILADLGAEVIKVEKLSGDEARKMEPKFQEDGVYFLNINRQKKSVTLNMKEDYDREKLMELIKTADVFVENYRLGVAQKLGIDYEAVKKINPKLIYCSLSAYGQNGPKKSYPGYDAIMQAETGIMSITGSTDLARVPVSLIDQGSAMWGALGVVSAILQRHKTDEGSLVSTSLYETGVFWANYHLLSTKLTGENPKKLGSNHGAFAPYGAFQTADGAIMIGISNNKLFEKLCEVLQKREWIEDTRYRTNEERVKNRLQLSKEIEQITKTEKSEALIQALEAGGVPVAQVKTMKDVLVDPQQIENKLIVRLPHIRDKEMYATRIPLTISNCDLTPTAPAPLLGEHNEELLGRDYVHDIK